MLTAAYMCVDRGKTGFCDFESNFVGVLGPEIERSGAARW